MVKSWFKAIQIIQNVFIISFYFNFFPLQTDLVILNFILRFVKIVMPMYVFVFCLVLARSVLLAITHCLCLSLILNYFLMHFPWDVHLQSPLHHDFPFPWGHLSQESALWLPQLTCSISIRKENGLNNMILLLYSKVRW